MADKPMTPMQQAMMMRSKSGAKAKPKMDAEDKADMKKGTYNAKEEAAEDKKPAKKA